ncbi:MAG: GNAT family N-acetyltransferase [Bacteroidales bacterium]
MTINIYTIAELHDYIASDSYLHSDIVPVSPERVYSYTNNPRADQQMPVLFTLTENDRLLAYRTVLPDCFLNGSERTAFAWLSGNFVAPEQRRKGLSTRLFKAVEEAWNGQLMYTNYAPASKAVYDSSGAFTQIKERPGKRYYMRSALATLHKERLRPNVMLKLADKAVNSIRDLVSGSGMQFPLPPDTRAVQIETLDATTKAIIAHHSGGSLFGRGAEEFEWIRSFPWVTENAEQKLRGQYHFTREVSTFKNLWYRIEHKTENAFLWITIVNEKLAVPYFFYTDRMQVVAARQLVLKEMTNSNCAYVTIRHPELGPVLGTRKNPFILSRSMPQRYFAHKSIAGSVPRDLLIHDGDGGAVFS